MLISLGRLVLRTLAVFLAVSLVTFLLSQLAPGEFFDEARLSQGITPASIDAMRSRYGLDQPLWQRYVHWLGGAIRGDLGLSLAYNVPATRLIYERALNTLLLSCSGAVLAWMIAIPWGVRMAVHAGSWVDRGSAALILVLLATPELLLALAIRYLALRSGSLPVGGMASPSAAEPSISDLSVHLILPAAALALTMVPLLWRHARAAIVETLEAPFVTSARALGIPPRRRLFFHVLPAAANPLISLLGLTVGSLLSASLVVEIVFGWPGLGPLLVEAAAARDLNLILGAVLAAAVFMAAGAAVSDLLLLIVDPRIRGVAERRA